MKLLRFYYSLNYDKSLKQIQFEYSNGLVSEKTGFLGSSDEESDAIDQEEKKEVHGGPVDDGEEDFEEPIVNLQKPLGGGNQIKSTHPNPSH